jgi:hypothetical protein
MMTTMNSRHKNSNATGRDIHGHSIRTSRGLLRERSRVPLLASQIPYGRRYLMAFRLSHGVVGLVVVPLHLHLDLFHCEVVFDVRKESPEASDGFVFG